MTLITPFTGQELADYTATTNTDLVDKESRIVSLEAVSSPMLVGEIITGWVYPTAGVNNTINPELSTVFVNVSQNTTIRVTSGVETRTITLVSTAYELNALDHSGYGKLMYCDINGNLRFTTNSVPSIPTDAEYILLGDNEAPSGNYTASGGNTFYWSPSIHSNHMITSNTSIPLGIINHAKTYDVKVSCEDFDIFGDGVTDNTENIKKLALVATQVFEITGRLLTVYFPAGTYMISTGINMNDMDIRGHHRDTTIIKNSTAILFNVNLFNIHKITLEDIGLGYYNPKEQFVFKHGRLRTTISLSNTYYCYIKSPDLIIYNVDFDYESKVFIAIYVENFRYVSIQKCTFALSQLGYASHVIRIQNPLSKEHSIRIANNVMYNGKTGIFFAGLRDRYPTVGAVVEGNNLFYMMEESISFDGLGDTNEVPVICNGTINTLSNDVDGRLVVTSDMVYTPDGILLNQPYPVSSRTDWTRYYFTFDENTGKEGSVIPIYSFDSANGTMTLDTFIYASDVTIGGNVGVHSGAFNCIIRDNNITGEYRKDLTKLNLVHGISLWLNVFNTTVENNTVTSCSSGVQLSGGLMQGTYKSRAYGNMIRGNRFIECCEGASDRDPVKITSEYTDTMKQYGNSFIGNLIQGGKKPTRISHQQNFTYRDNTFVKSSGVEFTHCETALPVASSEHIGSMHMKIVDDITTGLTNNITYHRCKLTAGIYAWYEI